MADTILVYDGQGFLVGEKLAEKTTALDDHVQEILKILKNEAIRQIDEYRISNYQRSIYEATQTQNFTEIVKQLKNISDNKSTSSQVHRDQNSTLPNHDQSRETVGTRRTEDPVDRINEPPKTGEENQDRKRDSQGRFIGGKAEQVSNFSQLIGRLGQAVNGIGHAPGGIDPSLDAINELSTVVSPVKRMVGFMFKPLSGFAKMRKRSEPLPKEETEHNRKQIRVLNKIADAIQKSKSNGLLSSILGSRVGGGLFGLLGKGGKGLGKLLKLGKGIPFLGTALTALSFSDWKTQSTAEKGSTVGSAVGGVAGAALGSVLGPVGTVAGGVIGSWAGDKLGGIVAPYVSSWTDDLKKADIPKKMMDKWYGLVEKLGQAFTVGKEVASLFVPQAVKNGYNYLTGNSADTNKIVSTGGNYDNPVSVGSTGEKGVKRIIVAKNGASNTLELNDGSIVKRTGARNWRNNNPGNIMGGKFAKSQGAIGSDGRFAIFPDYETGRKAKKKLLFDTDSYKNLDLMGAIHRYAPPKENDTARYQRNALKAVGGQNKRMSDYTEDERIKLLNAIQKEEGFSAGITTVLKESATLSPLLKSSLKQTTDNPSLAKTIFGTNTVQPLAKMIMPNTQQANGLNTSTSTNNIPRIVAAKQPNNTPDPQKVLVVNQSNDSINQNISDRALAHAITGGLGKK
ncbi:hypothetical protein [Acinetobacter boissieri]|uniref:Uncharacterized protein n=1 Tax=Acinetobacter boissieri TaxID=1219383 RepID=A0A1G6KCU3_9GAMM|nr:hypothetical protein [Acinetobacter boissieri]SDC28773.1 hypothetical protein SAMN05421733_11614 [Acinetobacter boissieri]